jgi:YHS domain-containing protein
MMRQIGKQILTMALWLGLALMARADGLVTTIVTDPLTGVAIDGYDPVSYFIDSEPHLGRPDFEYDWGGVPWYFESAANRDVFARNPDIYAPQYGGHCLMSLSRGYLSDGKPGLYLLIGLKLYFFYSTANRDAFLLSKKAALEAAAKNWPGLQKQLTGPEGATQAATALASAPADASASSAAPSSAPAVAPGGDTSHVQPN